MPKSRELPQLVPQDYGFYITQYKTPKEIVFREHADFLSPRQQEVMALVVDGRSYEEIADELIISRNTVGNHLTDIANKVEDTLKFLGLEVQSRRDTLWKIKVLLQLGEIELRDPDPDQART